MAEKKRNFLHLWPTGTGYSGTTYVRLFTKLAEPAYVRLTNIPSEGGLISTPDFAARRVRSVNHNIDPERVPVLIVDIHAP